MGNLLPFDTYSSIQKNSQSINESLRSGDFSFESLNEKELLELDYMAETSGLCTFDLICMQEGVGYDKLGRPMQYQPDYEIEGHLYEDETGWLAKEVNKQTAEIKPKVTEALKGLQLKPTPAVDSLIGMYITGLKKALAKNPKTTGKLFDIANTLPEHKKVVKILSNSYSKIIKDNDARLQSSLFSEDNKATAGNLATVQNAIKEVVFNLKEEGNKHGEKNKISQSVVNPKPWTEADLKAAEAKA